jgi:hypothetical protein
MRRALALVLLAAALGPTAVPRPVRAQGEAAPVDAEARLRELQDLAARAARRYGLAPAPEIVLAPWVGAGEVTAYAGASVVVTGGRVYVHPGLLSSPAREVAIAKAVAWETLRAPSRATTLAAWEQERTARVLAADIRAVEILVQVVGLPEPLALARMHAWLAALHRLGATGGASGAQAPSPCDEIRALVARFPAHRDTLPRHECGPE